MHWIFYKHKLMMGPRLSIRQCVQGATNPSLEKTEVVKSGWGDLLNLITLPEVVRRYLTTFSDDNKPQVFEEESSMGGFNPFEVLRDGYNTGKEVSELLSSQGVEKLEPGHLALLLRAVCDELHEAPAVVAEIKKKVEVSQVFFFGRIL